MALQLGSGSPWARAPRLLSRLTPPQVAPSGRRISLEEGAMKVLVQGDKLKAISVGCPATTQCRLASQQCSCPAALHPSQTDRPILRPRHR